jgi:hypothetical protein
MMKDYLVMAVIDNDKFNYLSMGIKYPILFLGW